MPAWRPFRAENLRSQILHSSSILTRVILEVAKPLGVAVHYHIIVGRDGHASLKSLKLI
jgi:DNA repair protein RadC